MKKTYTAPVINKFEFATNDIITLSGMGNQADDIGVIDMLSSMAANLEIPQ